VDLGTSPKAKKPPPPKKNVPIKCLQKPFFKLRYLHQFLVIYKAIHMQAYSGTLESIPKREFSNAIDSQKSA
jgi:hypothetical protein